MAEDQVFAELSDAERDWIDQHLAQARALGVVPEDVESISNFFDTNLGAVRAGRESPEVANMTVNLVAVLVGELIRHQTNLTWAIVTDDQGTDLCLHDYATSWTLFPQSSAAKRWEASEKGWVRPFCAWARESVSTPPA